MWSREAHKVGLSRDELVESYSEVEFGDRLRYVPDRKNDREEVVAFLLQNYDSHAEDLIRWLLDSSTVQAALRSTKTNAIIAFQTGVPLPLRTAEHTGNTLFCTPLCVIPALRSTGLVRKFLAANIKLSAERRYTVRCSTATTAIALNAVCSPKRYICWPEDRKLAKSVLRAAGLEPVSTARRKAMAILSTHAPRSGIDWSMVRLQDHPSVTYISTHKELGLDCAAAVLLSVNAASAQVLGSAATDPTLLRPLLVWAATYFRKAIVIDATHPSSLHSDITEWCKQDETNPQYHVYFHNVDVAPQECAIPML